MIYLFAGDDTNKKLKVFEDFSKSFSLGMEVVKFNRNNFDRIQVESFYSGRNLFAQKSMVIFSSILEHEELRDFILERLPYLASSSNDFIFLEGPLKKDILDSFRSVRAELNIFELPKEKREKYDNFLLANAFANRDKLNTWICFRQAVDRGVVMEELSGMLSWKVKDMLIKKNFSKFKEEELKNFITKLSYLLPQARSAGLDAETVFESFLLEAF